MYLCCTRPKSSPRLPPKIQCLRDLQTTWTWDRRPFIGSSLILKMVSGAKKLNPLHPTPPTQPTHQQLGKSQRKRWRTILTHRSMEEEDGEICFINLSTSAWRTPSWASSCGSSPAQLALVTSQQSWLQNSRVCFSEYLNCNANLLHPIVETHTCYIHIYQQVLTIRSDFADRVHKKWFVQNGCYARSISRIFRNV